MAPAKTLYLDCPPSWTVEIKYKGVLIMGLFNKKEKDLMILVKHHQGLPGISSNAPCFLKLDKSNEKLIIKAGSLNNPKEFQLSFSKIVSVGLATEETVKKVSGVGRAIVGGLLFSGVGAIVGATTARDKTKIVYYKVINYISNNEEKSVIFEPSNDLREVKFFSQLEKMFNHTEQNSGITEL